MLSHLPSFGVTANSSVAFQNSPKKRWLTSHQPPCPDEKTVGYSSKSMLSHLPPFEITANSSVALQNHNTLHQKEGGLQATNHRLLTRRLQGIRAKICFPTCHLSGLQHKASIRRTDRACFDSTSFLDWLQSLGVSSNEFDPDNKIFRGQPHSQTPHHVITRLVQR